MTGVVFAYVVAILAMLFAAVSGLTLFWAVEHVDSNDDVVMPSRSAVDRRDERVQRIAV
jgi:hypothetical protein